MENKNRTIDEFFIQKYEELEKENERLVRDNETLSKNCHFYEETIKNLKENFEIELRVVQDDNKYIRLHGCIWENSDREKYEYYKNLFNLKEEGENENE